MRVHDALRRQLRRLLYRKVTPARWQHGGVVLDAFIATNRFGAYCVPWEVLHRPAARAIADGRVWEADTLELIARTAPTGDVIHAGTFFGDFLPCLARSRRDDALVWAFEPNPVSARCAAITILLNDLTNVTLTPEALAANSGSGRLIVADADGVPLGGTSRLAHGEGADTAEAVAVNLCSIDEVVPADRFVGVIHLDVEGEEEAALSGALATLQRCRPVLVLESLPSDHWRAVHLDPLGYAPQGVVDGNHVLVASPPA